MLPLKDDNPTTTFPLVNISIIIINALVFLYELSLGTRVNYLFFTRGAIPFEITHGIDLPPFSPQPIYLTLITSMFLHGGFLHIFGNMLYLWIFGDNIEDAVGHFKYILFYLLCGVMGSLLHIYINFNSRVPIIGASGAISGVLGAYLLLYPNARVLTLVAFGFFWRIVKIPAVIVLGFWIIIQFFYGLASLAAGPLGGVAWFAHIGGFVAGILLIRVFKKR